MQGWTLHDRVRPYVSRAGLCGVSRLSAVTTCHDLVTVFIER